MTEKEKVFHKLSNASNEDLAKIYASVAGYDPFKRHSLILPSKVREETLKKIKEMIDKGAINFKPA